MTPHRVFAGQPLKSGDIPPLTEELYFDADFNDIIRVGVIPDGVIYIKFGDCFNLPLDVGVIPSSVKTLIFGNHFNRLVPKGVIPEGVVTLEFGKNFNVLLERESIPSTVMNLTFGKKFNNHSCGCIPGSVKVVRFGDNFNVTSTIGPFRSEIEEVYLGWKFNKFPHKSEFPRSLKKLVFGESFNQAISQDSLPETLEYLELGKKYNIVIRKGALPKTLKVLKFGENFNHPLSKGVLPEGLEIIEFGKKFDSKISLPNSVKRVLKEGKTFAFIPEEEAPLSTSPLPPAPVPPPVPPVRNPAPIFLKREVIAPPPEITVKTTVFERNSNKPKILVYRRPGNEKLHPSGISEGCNRIIFSDTFDQVVSEENIPKEITSLFFGENFTQDLINLPSQIQEIRLHRSFRGRIVFPPSLEILDIYAKANCQIAKIRNSLSSRFNDWKKEKDFKETIRIMSESERKILSGVESVSPLLSFILKNIISTK